MQAIVAQTIMQTITVKTMVQMHAIGQMHFTTATSNKIASYIL